MNQSQRVMIFSLAMIVCLAVSTVTSDEVDDAKAAAILAEMLYPEYANSPEFQAVQKRSPSSSESNEKKHTKQPEEKRGPSCTGIPGLDIISCGEPEMAPVMKRDCNSGISANDLRCKLERAWKRGRGSGNSGLDLLRRTRVVGRRWL